VYYKIKRFFLGKHIFGETGNNITAIRIIPLNDAILKNNHINSVKIIRYLYWENPFNVSEYGKYQYKIKEFVINNINEIEIHFNNYGSWTLEIQYCRDKRIVAKEIKTINIEASEYNIAYLAATLPVLIFLFDIWNISKKSSPTIVELERILFDYDNLPKNIFPFPLANKTELNTAYNGFNRSAQRMVSYIGMLYKMNPKAKFHLYLCDHQAYFVLPFMYANKIPEKNFTVHLLSDGTGSYNCFNFAFGTDNAAKLYYNMRDVWKLAKNDAFMTGIQKWGKETYTHIGCPCVSEVATSKSIVEQLANRFAYSYVMTNENPNFELILHDINLLKGNHKVLNEMTNRVHNIDFTEGKRAVFEHNSELCKLLGFKKQPFEDSCKLGKKICILLGNFPLSENYEKYIEKTVSFFGQEYDYYLKDHPWVVDDEQRIQNLKNKGIKTLNSRIPTEIYMMLDSKVYLAGYLSSTFLSVSLLDNPAEQVLSIWDTKKRITSTTCFNFVAKTAMNIENNAVVIYD